MNGFLEKAEFAGQAITAQQALALVGQGQALLDQANLGIVANECRTARRSRWWSVVRTGTLPEAVDQAADENIGFVAEWHTDGLSASLLESRELCIGLRWTLIRLDSASNA